MNKWAGSNHWLPSCLRETWLRMRNDSSGLKCLFHAVKSEPIHQIRFTLDTLNTLTQKEKKGGGKRANLFTMPDMAVNSNCHQRMVYTQQPFKGAVLHTGKLMFKLRSQSCTPFPIVPQSKTIIYFCRAMTAWTVLLRGHSHWTES